MKDPCAIGGDIGAAGQSFALANNLREVLEVFLVEALEMIKEFALLHFYRSFMDFPPNNLPVSLE